MTVVCPHCGERMYRASRPNHDNIAMCRHCNTAMRLTGIMDLEPIEQEIPTFVEEFVL